MRCSAARIRTSSAPAGSLCGPEALASAVVTSARTSAGTMNKTRVRTVIPSPDGVWSHATLRPSWAPGNLGSALARVALLARGGENSHLAVLRASQPPSFSRVERLDLRKGLENRRFQHRRGLVRILVSASLGLRHDRV